MNCLLKLMKFGTFEHSRIDTFVLLEHFEQFCINDIFKRIEIVVFELDVNVVFKFQNW